jgi:hypothetical protein
MCDTAVISAVVDAGAKSSLAQFLEESSAAGVAPTA